MTDSFSIPASLDVQEMQKRQQRDQASIIEAKILRDRLRTTLAGLEQIMDRYDDNPDDAVNATLFIALSTIVLDSFVKDASHAAIRLNSMIED